MKAVIKHEIPGRMRVHFNKRRFTFKEADTLQYYLLGFDGIKKAVVYERPADAVVNYSCKRSELLEIIRNYSPEQVNVPDSYFESSSRELNAKYYEKIVMRVVWHYGKTMFIPVPIRTVLTCAKAVSDAPRSAAPMPSAMKAARLSSTLICVKAVAAA